MTRKTFAVLLVLFVAAGAYAACGKGGCGKKADPGPAMMHGCGHGMKGCGETGDEKGCHSGEMTLEDQRKALDEQIACLKETAQLRLDLQVKQLELRKLWLYEEPNVDKISSKLSEILVLGRQLKEKCEGMCHHGRCGAGHGCGTGMMPGMSHGCGGTTHGSEGCHGGGCHGR